MVGHFNHFRHKFRMYPEHKVEQVIYRLEQCADTCVETGKCKHCGCPTKKKVFDETSCNGGEVFPNMMNKEKWEAYKLEHSININLDDESRI